MFIFFFFFFFVFIFRTIQNSKNNWMMHSNEGFLSWWSLVLMNWKKVKSSWEIIHLCYTHVVICLGCSLWQRDQDILQHTRLLFTLYASLSPLPLLSVCVLGLIVIQCPSTLSFLLSINLAGVIQLKNMQEHTESEIPIDTLVTQLLSQGCRAVPAGADMTFLDSLHN